jgi:predicted GIY-YIG superfamily endonuclease
MIVDNYNKYKIKITGTDFKCIEVNGESTNHFIAPDTRNNIPKLYVVKDNNNIYYVGITSQSIRARLKYGFKAHGENGYWGYKWKNSLEQAEVYVWCFDNEEIDIVEAIEGELVYFIREKTGKWPKNQMEIHFHPDITLEQQQSAKEILSQCLTAF